jgi:branched-chain amino acid transport system permease protein
MASVSSGLHYFVQQLINGLAVGSMYAMIAVGYSMVYSILYLINFAHGDLYVFGTFIALALWKAGLPLPAVVVLACLAGALVGMLVERTVYRPVRFANRIVPMITALGVAMVLKTTSQVLWGAETLPFFQLVPRQTVTIGDFRIFSQQILVLGTALVCMIIFSLIIQKTKIGKATQCVMQDINLSKVMGIPVDTIIPWIYALGGFMGVIGGILFSSYYNAVSIDMGILGTVKAWAAAMLGGVGSFYGAFLGGLILGVGESLAGAYLSSAYRDAFGYLIIVLVLLIKPTGLFGKRRIEKV